MYKIVRPIYLMEVRKETCTNDIANKIKNNKTSSS